MSLQLSLALIGFGEAGHAFASAGQWREAACAFDIDPGRGAAMRKAGVTECQSAAGALKDASLVLSLVTADAALNAAQSCALLLREGALWCDMNSVSPQTKQAASEECETRGAHFVDVAIMAPVEPARLNVPLLVSGPEAERAVAALASLGFTKTREVGSKVGSASTIKLLRSIIIKGIEALTAESLLAAAELGVLDDVIAALGDDWETRADYNFDRMMIHGKRRAAEMDEACRMLRGAGCSTPLSEATAAWQRHVADCAAGDAPIGLAAKLERLRDDADH